MIKLNDYKNALSAALGYAGLSEESITIISVNEFGEYLELHFYTDYLEYEVFVENETGFVAGFNTRPIIKNCKLSIEKLIA